MQEGLAIYLLTAEAIGAGASGAVRENRAPIEAKNSTNIRTPMAAPTVRDISFDLLKVSRRNCAHALQRGKRRTDTGTHTEVPFHKAF